MAIFVARRLIFIDKKCNDFARIVYNFIEMAYRINMQNLKEAIAMKKWNNAELVTLDINMTANGNNKNRTEGNTSQPGKSEKNGRPAQNDAPSIPITPSNPVEIIDDFFNKSDVNQTS